MRSLRDILYHILAFSLGSASLLLLAHLQHRFSAGDHGWKAFMVPVLIGGTIGVSLYTMGQRVNELSSQLSRLCSSALDLSESTLQPRKTSSTIFMLLIAALGGALLLSTFSIAQKLINGFPFNPKGFIIPVPVGALCGLIFGLYLRKLKRFQLLQAATLGILSSEKRRLANIIETIHDGILVADRDHEIELLNPACHRLLGTEENELPIKDLWGFLKNMTTPYQSAQFTIPEDNTPFLIQARHTGCILRATTNPLIKDTGEKTGQILVLQDMSEEKRVERLKSEFITTATHELNTPITALAGFSELLLKGDFPPEQQQEFLETIGQKAWHVSNILDNLLNIDSVDSPQQIILNKERYSITEIMAQIEECISSAGKSREVTLDIQNQDTELNIDIKRVKRIFCHLLSNAAKFSDISSPITVRGKTVKDRYLFEIEDQGIGMSPDDLEKVFDKFFRADSSNTALEGIGLGMSVVKTLLEAHDGDINIDSQINQGTTVQFSLPLF